MVSVFHQHQRTTEKKTVKNANFAPIVLCCTNVRLLVKCLSLVPELAIKKLLKKSVFNVIVVDRLQNHWEDSQTKLSDRTKQLHNMLQDSTEWLDAKRGVDHHIKQASERLESWQEITYTMEDVKRQNTELKVGRNNLSSNTLSQIPVVCPNELSNYS